MLNLKEIAERIAQPSLCQANDADDLKKLCETYPYSQLFPILYLNVLSKSNDVRFEDELQRYAYRISDRTMLYNLLNQTTFEVEKIREEPKPEIPETQEIEEIQLVQKAESVQEIQEIEEIQIPISIEKEAEIQEIDETPVISEIEPILEKEEIRQEEIVLEIEQPILETEEIADETLEKEEVSSEAEEVPFELDLSEVTDENIAEEVQTTDHANEIEAEVVIGFESIPIDEVFQKLEAVQQEKAIQFEDELTAQTIASAYSIEEEEKRLAKEKRDSEAKKAEKEIPEVIKPIEVESKKSFSSWLHANKNHTEIKEEKVNVDDLISKFIEESPKISPLHEKLFEDRTEKTEFYSPVKKAKESLDENNMPVSETLAKVFAAQGNYPKAIYAYEQLMLIIPEKKIFFAVQIKELEKKLNK